MQDSHIICCFDNNNKQMVEDGADGHFVKGD